MKMFKKEKEVVKLARKHMDTTAACVRGATMTVKAYMAGDIEGAKQAAGDVDKAEATGDSLLREIRDLLYSGAYMPAMREDIYYVLGAVDQIANIAESCCDFFVDQHPEIPADLSDEFVQAIEGCEATFNEFYEVLRQFFRPKGKLEELRQHAEQVSVLESKVDEFESSLTTKVFASSLEIGRKLHLRRTIQHIVLIADTTEDACNEVELVSVKTLI